MDKYLKLFKKIVSINSVYLNEKELAEFCFEFFKKYKVKVKKQFIDKKRFNVLAEKGHGERSIMLYSHLDTVAVTKGWVSNPFQLKLVKDKAIGLGAWDMKGSLFINLLTFIKQNPTKYKLKLALCVDEENISEGGYVLSESDFIQDVDCVISCEPAFKYGQQGIVTGRIGRAVYTIEIKGSSKHFAVYEKKYDINYFLAAFLKKLKVFFKENKDGSKQFVFARKLESSSIGMSIPESTFVELDSSIISPSSPVSIKNKLENILNQLNKKCGINFDIKVNFFQRNTPFLKGYRIKKTDKFLIILKESIEKVTKRKAIAYFRPSVADENIFAAKGISTLGVGPVGANAHAPNEWVSLSSLEKLYKILNNFLAKII